MPTEPKIKVLQVLPTLDSGGVERGTVDVAMYLKKHGCGSYVCSAGGALENILHDSKVTHYKLSVNSKNPLKILLNAYRLYRIIKQSGINIIHARSRAPAWSCYIAAKLSSIKYLTTFHGTYSLNGGFVKRRYNSIMTKGSHVIAVSEFIKRHIMQYYQVPSSRIVVIDRWVDLQYFDPALCDEQIERDLRHKFALTNRDKVIIVPGRFTDWKGQRYFLKILSTIKAPYKCIFVGKIQDKDSYIKKIYEDISTYGLEHTVQLSDSTPHMRELYKIADIIVVPSTRPEAFGRVVIEAQAMGRVVISTDIGAQQYNIAHNSTGFIIPHDDVKKAAEIVEQVLTTKDLGNIQAAAKVFAQKNFCMQKQCAKILAVYKKIVG